MFGARRNRSVVFASSSVLLLALVFGCDDSPDAGGPAAKAAPERATARAVTARSGAGATRQMTFVNRCDQTVWLAADVSPAPSTSGWEMPPSTACGSDSDCPSGFTCDTSNGFCQLVLQLPLDGNGIVSGRFWPRTDCSFGEDGLCTSIDGAKTNCCATGGCIADGSGDYGLNCTGSGQAPTTVAEFTLQGGADNDFYDVSVIDGFNVPVVMEPDTQPACPGSFGDCNYWCGNPGGRVPATPGLRDYGCRWDSAFDPTCGGGPEWVVVDPAVVSSSADCKTPAQFRATPVGDVCTCGLDSGGLPQDGDCASGQVCGFGNNQIIGTRVCGEPVGCTTGKALCGIGAYFLGSGGENCQTGSDCASGQCVDDTCTPSPADFLDCGESLQYQVPCSTDDDCPAFIGFPCQSADDCPTGTDCVPLGAGTDGPQVCRQRCSSGTCAGWSCQTDEDCLTLDDDLSKPSGTFARCVGGQCTATMTSLLEASGLNGQSCYIHYYPSQASPSLSCGGCPTDCDDPPCAPWPPASEECLSSNPAWVGVVQDQLIPPKTACPTAYTFPFDDPTSTFQCSNGAGGEAGNTQSYTVTFCEPEPTV